MQDQKILNALRMQPLSEEEKTSRHILGRLYGPIATCVESTRNGRLYNRTLWEKALVDEIFLEKVATKALFLELGHPADREETDMKQACACIPEVPKIVGDELYAYVDILDTPNGRLLKTLVDYGFVPGISSRGSGDVMDNNQVDPETFFLETWDIVQLPAVKKARLNVCESLDSDSIKLRRALAESYETAKEEDKDTMKQALENLKINLEEPLTETQVVSKNTDNLFTVVYANDPEGILFTGTEADCIAFVDEHATNAPHKLVITKGATVPVVEELDSDIPWDNEEDELSDTLVEDAEDDTEDDAEEDKVEEIASTDEETENTTGTEEIEDDSEEDPKDVIVDVTAEGEVDVNTVSDVVELLQDYDDSTKVEFEAVQVDGQEHPVDGITAKVAEDGEEKVLVIGINCDDAEVATETVETDEVVTDDDITETEEEPADETSVEEIVADDDTADDDGDDEVIESLKEMIRKKEALETELSDLRKAKSVGDAKEKELQEMLSRYRIAFKKAHADAVLVPELQAKVTELSENLNNSRKTIETLTEQVNDARQLKESVEVSTEAKLRKLSEQVEKMSRQNKALEAQLEDTTKQYTKKLQERTDVAKMYKKRCVETLTRYIDSKASMLGVASSEITSRLNESYTLSDVDAVCDKILNSTVNLGRLPFGGRTKAAARISESVSRNTTASSFTDPSNGYDIDDSLLELAGLK